MLVNVVLWISDEIEFIGAVVECGVLGALHVPRSPVTINEAPRTLQKHSGPGIPEFRSLEFHARFVACSFGIALYDFAVKPSIAINNKNTSKL